MDTAPARSFAVLLLAMSYPSAAQTPKFEVVSIKPCRDGQAPPDGGAVRHSGDRLTLECHSLEWLARNAYELYATGTPWPVNPLTGMRTFPLPPNRMTEPLKGGPAWVRSQRFTIVAKADRPAAIEMMRGPMMQAVLTERFRLRLHRERKEVRVYELVTTGKSTSGLRKTPPGSCVAWDQAKGPPPTRTAGQPALMCGGQTPAKDGFLDFHGVTLSDVCVYLSLNLGRDVIDRTGIAGTWDFHLEVGRILPMPPGSGPAGPDTPLADDPGGNLLAALRKLGLALRPAKKPIELLMIDSAEKPTPN